MTIDTKAYRKTRALGLIALVALLGLPACDFLDPTSVENPRTTDEDLAQARNPTASLLPGLRAQFSRLVEATVTVTENVSDNYSVHGTGLSGTYDTPRQITPQIVNATGGTGAYWNAQELRALATFVLDDIVPIDENAAPEDVAEAHYYRGMGALHLAENFVAAVAEEDEAPSSPAALFALAEADLLVAEAGGGDIGVAAAAALARLYRWTGNAAGAESFASDVLAADDAFLFTADFDASSLANTPHAFLVSRTLREMQPLPRLDFLDPKYLMQDSPIPVAKAEEMHLILAEVDMAAGAWAAGRKHLAQAIEAAQARGTESFDDTDPRISNDFSVRPRDEEILIRADADAELRAGLVLERPGTIDAPTVSGTSLDADSIRAIPATEEDALLHALYLARQEILFLEGRRMADLGIRLPIMFREIETNPNLSEGDTGTEVLVPSWIPPEDEMDKFTPASPYPEGTAGDDVDVEPSTLEVVMLHDLNRILVENRAAALPLF